MKLTFGQEYLSIKNFAEISLPCLTVVIGLNGSGKSQLLAAISNGCIINEIGSNGSKPLTANSAEIRLLSPYQTLTDIKQYNSTAESRQSLHIFGNFNQWRAQVLRPLRDKLLSCIPNLETDVLKKGEDPWKLGIPGLTGRSVNQSVTSTLNQIFAEANQALLAEPPRERGMRNPSFHQNLREVSDMLAVDPVTITQQIIEQAQPWLQTVTTSSISLIFGRYRDELLRNKLRVLTDERDQTQTTILNDEFQGRFGFPPWDLVTENLKAFDLPYVAERPDLLDLYGPVNFTIRHVDSGDAIQINALSSGEKILFEIALSTFIYNVSSSKIVLPKLLLLDEMDSALHPKTALRFISSVRSGFVEQKGIICVLTTHSPTTVAMVPEEALYEMVGGSAGLRKISKQEAINKLTVGVPTISLNFSGRRQVFVESDTDLAALETIYQSIRDMLHCERDLNFLSTGLRNKGQADINTGCSIVKSLVSNLRSSGNRSVFGIIDWDTRNHPADGVCVLAERVCYAIENLVLDPFLVGLMLIKRRVEPDSIKGVYRFKSADSFSEVDRQAIADCIQDRLITKLEEVKIEMKYVGGIK